MPSIDAKQIDHAAATLLAGGLVAMPTETVYGLAADATNDHAVAKIFDVKGRPQFNPLIVHVASIHMAAHFAEISPLANKLATLFWPGPLTLVLPRRANCDLSLLVSAGLQTVALRSPAHPAARQLIAATNRPLAAPSANLSGTISPTTASHVQESLGEKVDYILDGGACSIGVESTILKVDSTSDGNDKVWLLRAGGLDRETIAAAIGQELKTPDNNPEKPQSPGMLSSHYAPATRLKLNITKPNPNEAFLGFGPLQDAPPHYLNLSAKGDLREAAANLFAHLRALDGLCQRLGLATINAAPVPSTSLGEAINDRLERAAAPRPHHP